MRRAGAKPGVQLAERDQDRAHLLDRVDPDGVEVRVQEQRASARPSARRPDHRRAAVALDRLHVEPRVGQPAGDEACDLTLAGRTGDERGIDGVDLDERRREVGDLAHFVSARMRAASTAAFLALSTPTVATGTPGGIWTIESSASIPSSTDIDDRSGTPITGSSVCAATTPGSAAASPAPQISTLIPRPAAVFEYSATESGVRCADRTSNSQAIPRASSSSIAACMRARSDSEPTRMPTTASGMRDVPPVLRAFARHELAH